MASTGGQLRDLVRRTLGFGNSAADDTLIDKGFCRVRFTADSPTAWATAGTTGTIVVGETDRAFVIDRIALISVAALTLDDTNTTTLTVSKSDGASATLTTVGTYANSTAGNGTAAALVPKAGTLGTAANLYVAAGSVLSIAKTVAASGTAVAANTKILIEGYWA